MLSNNNNKKSANRIDGATNNIFTPVATNIGANYYFLVTTNSKGCSDTSTASNVFNVIASPIITTNINSSVNNAVCLNNINNPQISIQANANGGGTVSYQWFKTKISNKNGAKVDLNINVNAYRPSTSIADTSYYFVVVKNSNGCNDTSNISGSYSINPAPQITIANFGAASYCQNVPINTSFIVSSPNTLTYIWKSGTVPRFVLSKYIRRKYNQCIYSYKFYSWHKVLFCNCNRYKFQLC